MGCTLKDSKKEARKFFVLPLIMSYTVTSRENVYRIFHLLGEPKTL